MPVKQSLLFCLPFLVTISLSTGCLSRYKPDCNDSKTTSAYCNLPKPPQTVKAAYAPEENNNLAALKQELLKQRARLKSLLNQQGSRGYTPIYDVKTLKNSLEHLPIEANNTPKRVAIAKRKPGVPSSSEAQPTNMIRKDGEKARKRYTIQLGSFRLTSSRNHVISQLPLDAPLHIFPMKRKLLGLSYGQYSNLNQAKAAFPKLNQLGLTDLQIRSWPKQAAPAR